MAQNEKIEHDFKCEVCGKVAVYNVQNWWHKYVIYKDGTMHEVSDWEGDENHFFCDKHQHN